MSGEPVAAIAAAEAGAALPDPADLARTHALCFTRPPPWPARAFADLLATPGILFAGDARAFGLARVVADEAELLTLAVHPERRRRGLGRALLAALGRAAAARGARRMLLEVAADNAPALALYRGAGFAPVGRRPGYARGGGEAVDALILARALDAPAINEPDGQNPA